MLSRVEYSEWLTLFPKVGFALFATAFCIVVWRALRMPKSKLVKASRMPLEND